MPTQECLYFEKIGLVEISLESLNDYVNEYFKFYYIFFDQNLGQDDRKNLIDSMKQRSNFFVKKFLDFTKDKTKYDFSKLTENNQKIILRLNELSEKANEIIKKYPFFEEDELKQKVNFLKIGIEAGEICKSNNLIKVFTDALNSTETYDLFFSLD